MKLYGQSIDLLTGYERYGGGYLFFHGQGLPYISTYPLHGLRYIIPSRNPLVCRRTRGKPILKPERSNQSRIRGSAEPGEGGMDY